MLRDENILCGRTHLCYRMMHPRPTPCGLEICNPVKDVYSEAWGGNLFVSIGMRDNTPAASMRDPPVDLYHPTSSCLC